MQTQTKYCRDLKLSVTVTRVNCETDPKDPLGTYLFISLTLLKSEDNTTLSTFWSHGACYS